MEDLMVVINMLEDERERLFAEKDKNLLVIQGYDKRIGYFRYIIDCYSWWENLKTKQMESYNRILDFSFSNHSLLFSSRNNLDDYIEATILKLEKEIEEIEASQKKMGSALVTTIGEKEDLEIRNEQIDLRLRQIDEELENSSNKTNEKVYILERGNK